MVQKTLYITVRFVVYVNYKKNLSSLDVSDLDQEKVKAFLNETKALVEDVGGQFVVNPVDFLKDYFKSERSDDEVDLVLELVKKTFNLALLELSKSREEEGSKLVAVIKQHLKDYKGQEEIIRSSSGEFESVVKERLNSKFEKHLEEQDVDKSRFLQEVVYYLERMDICEEINRIDAHILRLEQLLDRGGEMGRKIDFTIQELNRETNTIGSKSNVGVISESVVELKLFLEKIREQALNLE